MCSWAQVNLPVRAGCQLLQKALTMGLVKIVKAKGVCRVPPSPPPSLISPPIYSYDNRDLDQMGGAMFADKKEGLRAVKGVSSGMIMAHFNVSELGSTFIKFVGGNYIWGWTWLSLMAME